MSEIAFNNFRRFYHVVDINSPEAKAAANKLSADYDPVFKMHPLTDEFNTTADLLMNLAKNIACDENTFLSFVYGPSGFLKRTPGKKVSQGGQAISVCSKFPAVKAAKAVRGADAVDACDGRPASLAIEAAPATTKRPGAIWMHGFEFDVSKGAPTALDKKQTNVNNILLRVLSRLFSAPRYKTAQHYLMCMDSRFYTTRQALIFFAAWKMFVLATIKTNLEPLAGCRKEMFMLDGVSIEKKQMSEKKKKDLREKTPNVAILAGAVAAVVGVDQGVFKICTTLPNQILIEIITRMKQRRK